MYARSPGHAARPAQRIGRERLSVLLVLASLTIAGFAAMSTAAAAATILVYHRFGAIASDGMTVTTPVFEQQLDWLAAHGYRIVPLPTLVAGLQGKIVAARRPRCRHHRR
jgi:hypothetical protein